MSKTRVISVRKDGAVFRVAGERTEISFKECAENFRKETGASGHSVASRDIRRYRFLFYSEPKIEIRFSGPFRKMKFHSLQKKIERSGYHTFDIS